MIVAGLIRRRRRGPGTAGGAGGGSPPHFLFQKKILFNDAFVNISSFCILYFLFYKEENRELGAIFCLLACLLFIMELEKC